MTGILKRLAVILWAVSGFIGIGALSASLWLERELARTSRARPMVQFTDADQRVERDCPPIFRPIDASRRNEFLPLPPGGGARGGGEQRRMLRISQLLTLIEAGVATPDLEREFCAELEVLSAEAYDRLAAVNPAFAPATAQVCEVILRASDAGAEE